MINQSAYIFCAHCRSPTEQSEALKWMVDDRVALPRTDSERRLLDPPGRPLSPKLVLRRKTEMLCQDCYKYAQDRERASLAFHRSFGLVLAAVAFGFFILLSIPAAKSTIMSFIDPAYLHDWKQGNGQR